MDGGKAPTLRVALRSQGAHVQMAVACVAATAVAWLVTLVVANAGVGDTPVVPDPEDSWWRTAGVWLSNHWYPITFSVEVICSIVGLALAVGVLAVRRPRDADRRVRYRVRAARLLASAGGLACALLLLAFYVVALDD